MTLTKATRLALAGLLTASCSVAVLAQDANNAMAPTGNAMAPAGDAAASTAIDPEIAVDARQALMRSNGATLRGAGAASGPEAITAADILYNNFEAIPALFPRGSGLENSRALPIIWEDWEGFVATAEKAAEAAEKAQTTAQAGDMAGYKAAIESIGPICGECHGKYRAP